MVTDDPDRLVEEIVRTSGDLMRRFGLDLGVPFVSSTRLRNAVGISKAILFADLLVTAVQPYVSSVHFSYVILPPSKVPSVRVGTGSEKCRDIPTRVFVANLGPMFSYLTAHSYLWMRGYKDLGDLEVQVDAFRSKQTKAWRMLTDAVPTRVFQHGDECNPLIMLADMIAFLTDSKLYGRNLLLNPHNIISIWKKYAFDVTTRFLDHKGLPFCTWDGNRLIGLTDRIARPLVYVAIDDIEGNLRGDDRPDDGLFFPDEAPRKFNQAIKQSPVYDAALTYAYQSGGCVKFYSAAEDLPLVRDGDVFAYVGDESRRIGQVLRHGYQLDVMSGLELRDLVKKGKN